MLTIQQILQQNRVERRSIGRTYINRNALMFVAGQAGVHSCCVRDATNHGAGIRLKARHGATDVSVDFDDLFNRGGDKEG